MNDIEIYNGNSGLDFPGRLAAAGRAANGIASKNVFEDYRDRKAHNTLRRQDADLALFAAYLNEAGLQVGDFAQEPEAWEGVTWGLVEGFVRWQLGKGYAVPSVNIRLSTVKGYAKLALKAGTLDQTEYALIRAVSGYAHREQKRIDERRTAAELPTRLGSKKAACVVLTFDQAKALKKRPNTPQGRRDALLMSLLIDHGLRCGEVAGLTVDNFDLKAGELRFYRPKVDKYQTHKLSKDTLKAAKAYFKHDAPALGLVLRGSRKGKTAARLDGTGMSERAITKRVEVLGESVGAAGLSAHDLRHYWATQAARNGTPLDRLQDAGGWNSPAMPLRYVQSAKIANMGVLLGE
jgi:integrase